MSDIPQDEKMMAAQKKVHQRNAAGFTLIELMVAVALAVVLFFGLASLYMLMNDSWERGSSLVNLQRDGSYAMMKLTTTIRAGSAAIIAPSTQLTVKDAGNTTIGRFYLESGDQSLRDDSGNKVIPSLVDSLVFTQSGPTIYVELMLADDKENTAYFTTGASLRN